MDKKTLNVYGDSFSEITNRLRKTNGPLWSERLADMWTVTLRSYAKAGAHLCSDVADQVHKAETNGAGVHAILGGVTDIVEASTPVPDLVQCLGQIVTDLVAKDANAQIMIVGLPSLEHSPLYLNNDQQESIRERLVEYNLAIESSVKNWQVQETPINVVYVDTMPLFQSILEQPSEYGITDAKNAYWEACLGRCTADVDSYLWWDNLHLTGAGHTAMAEYIATKQPFEITAQLPLSNYPFELTDPTDYYDYAPIGTFFFIASLILLLIMLVRSNRLTHFFK